MNIPLMRFADRRIGVPLCRCLAWAVKIRRSVSGRGDPQRILIMRGFGVGNLALMLPTLQALRERFPSARIDAVTLESNRGFLERTGYFSRICYLRDASITAFCGSFAAALGSLLATKYDLFVDFEQFARTSAILSLLLGIPRRIGFATPMTGRASAYTDAV
jgi:ADP-heptose:LPS heptosyltransferase